MSAGPPDGAPAPPPGRAALARRLRAELGPPPRREEWPPVSIVVLNRDGEDHLRLLLPRLAEATAYPTLELVLVDNGSRDGSVDFARSAELPFPVTVIENEQNLSFSDANDDGAERARYDHILFLNNDIEPFEPGWLKELVASLERDDAAAAGAMLLHGEESGSRHASGYLVQHTGIELASEAGRVIPVNSGDGGELCLLGPDARVPAATAACLLVRREAFRSVGGFTTGFQWGWEDVDFGLALHAAGEEVLCCRRSVLFHNESSTRFSKGKDWRRQTKEVNRRLFAERWGPQVRREYLLDRIWRVGFWTDSKPPRLAIALTGDPARDLPVRELADAVEGEEGWRVSLVQPRGEGRIQPPADTDFILVTDPSVAASLPPGLATVAWVGDRVEEWLRAPLLRRVELTLASDLGVARSLEAGGVAAALSGGAGDARQLVGQLSERAQRLRFCLKLSRSWGLEAAALALRRSLEIRGHACALQLADEWDLLEGMSADVAIALGDPGRYCPKPAQLNVLWTPYSLRATGCDPWDLVLVPEGSAAASLDAATPTPVAALELRSGADSADLMLEHVAGAAAREGVQARVAAHA